MAYFQNRVVLPKQEYIEFELEDEEDEEENENDDVFIEPNQNDNNNNNETEHSSPPPSTSSPITTVILALPNATTTVSDNSPEPKRQQSEQMEEKTDSRKLFQRLWTDEDEIGLLQGFLDYNANRGNSYHNDTVSFYDQIKSKFHLEFNKSQLVDKLRRLKKKYRNVIQKMDSGKEFIFKSAHDQTTFEISHKIWNNSTPIAVPVEDDEEISPNPNPNSAHATPVKNEPMIDKKTVPSRKRSRTTTEEKRELNDLNNDNHNSYTNNSNSNNDVDDGGVKCNGRHNVSGLIEETVKSCLTPVLKELANSTMSMGSTFGGGRGFGVGGLSLNPMPFSFLNLGSGEKVVDEKWKKQQILELEVYSKRLELVQDEIKVALEELRSSPGGGGVGGVGKL